MFLYNIAIGTIALIFAGFTLYYQRESVTLMRNAPMSARQRAAMTPPAPWWKTRQVAAIALLAILTWVPWGYGLIFPTQPESAVGDFYYGRLPDGDMYVFAVLKDSKPDKKLIAVAFHYKGLVDENDVKDLQKSETYDYTQGQKILLIDPDLPLNFHPAAIRASAVDTPIGAV
ncbi:MAG: hypothetical protein ACLPXW_07315 [Xanthobacteraceae bacterium]